CVDNNSIVQCVKDNDIAYAAPGVNNDGIQVECAGYANQTRTQWLDEYSRMVLNRAAMAVSQYLLKYDLPVVHLSNEDLGNGGMGIIGHAQASQVYKRSTHTDPGVNFPWDYFMKLVVAYHAARKALYGVA
ncbi:MAG TPA: N-acetylmuramoyl-L-alanine amidase, partial [Gemmatimonadaceae bacterium]|nr:N-acetylmuramoyl-L-alanine amidase [Gemmatimonadaceae bacterium]